VEQLKELEVLSVEWTKLAATNERRMAILGHQILSGMTAAQAELRKQISHHKHVFVMRCRHQNAMCTQSVSAAVATDGARPFPISCN